MLNLNQISKLPKEKLKAIKRKANQKAWESGRLKHLLFKHQIPIYTALKKALDDPKCLKYTLKCSRRWGKSTILSLIAIETALQKPNQQIRFVAPTAKALKKILIPIFRKLLKDCPEEFRPEYKVIDQIWVFKNGSEIHCAGTDSGSSENLRGTTSHLNLIDEAGFADDLKYILNSVLLPQTLTTGGKTLLASTPSKYLDHDFTTIAEECRLQGYYSCFTINDNPTITPEIKEQYAKESGGKDSTTFRREYLCEDITDNELKIVPEWQDTYIQEFIPENIPNYTHFHKYVAMDMGVRDATALVFGFYNFRTAVLYIEDEITFIDNDQTTRRIAEAILEKEKELWNQPPYRRVADNNNLQLLIDLQSEFQIPFRATSKDSLEAMVNELRILVQNGRLIVHPRCKYTIGCLQNGRYDKNRTKFARSQIYKHFDHLAALVYLVRNLDRHSNPFPNDYGYDFQQFKRNTLTDTKHTLLKALGLKRSS